MELQDLIKLINDELQEPMFKCGEDDTFSKEIIPGKVHLILRWGRERIPDLIILGNTKDLAGDIGYPDLIGIFQAWTYGGFEMGLDLDWDTDDTSWSFSMTLDLYHAWRSPEQWLRSALNIIYLDTLPYPAWVNNSQNNFI